LERIGADVVNEPAPDAAHAPFAVRSKRDRPILVALLRRVGEMLAAVLDPFDRPAQQSRGRDDGDILGIDAKLWAKAATDIGCRHAQAAFVERNIVG